jgi:hypothetical protein
MAATGASRAVFGAVLPFAARPMFEKLGVNWACSLLGFVSLVGAVIPFVFYFKGPSMKANSKFCQYLAQLELEDEKKHRKRHQKETVEQKTVEQKV